MKRMQREVKQKKRRMRRNKGTMEKKEYRYKQRNKQEAEKGDNQVR